MGTTETKCTIEGLQSNKQIDFQSYKRQIEEARQIFSRIDIDKIYENFFCRLYVSNNQKHLIEIILKLKTKEQKQQFMMDIQDANIDMLDSLDYNIKHLKQDEIYKLQRWRQCQDKIIDIKNQVIYNDRQYQQFKNVGLNLLVKNKICFVIFAGGCNFRFGSSIKQLQKLAIPSEKCLLQHLLHRLNALGQRLQTKLQVILMLNQHKFSLVKQLIRNLSLIFVKVICIQQMSFGCTNLQGSLLLTKDKQNKFGPLFLPNGTGDFLDFFKTGNLPIDENKQYLQIIGVSNILQHCFDCYMAGRVFCQGLDWGTKIVDSFNNFDPKIILNHNKQVEIRDPLQLQFYPKKCKMAFANNTIVSIKFIKNCINNENWQNHRKYRRKVSQVPKQTFIYPTTEFIQHYQSQFTDIFKLSDKYKLFKCERSQYYYQMIYNQGMSYSLQSASLALSDFYKNWLGIKLSNKSNKCEVNPYISLEGEDLEEVKKQLKKNGAIFPLYITLDEQN